MNEEDVASPRVVRSVREFVAGLSRWFAGHKQLQNVAIAGEVSGLKEFGSGHLGFTLKEDQSILECVVWSDNRRALPPFSNGVAVIAAGNVRIRPERSGYQLLVESIELTGLGELYVLYERLKEQFRREGLFEETRKRRVPPLPRSVVVISASGKGMEDFVKTLQRDAPFVDVQFVETRVQGVGAEIDVARAIDDASHRNPDVIVLTRGGGTYEDLFAFNREPVVRAIVRAKVPVVTAIGHSSDHHLADDVADMAFGTPSLAAEYIGKGWTAARTRLQNAQRELARATRDAVRRGEQLNAAAGNLLERAFTRVAAVKQHALFQRTQRLEGNNPQRVLADMRSRAAAGAGRLDAAASRLTSLKTDAWRRINAAFDRAVVADANDRARRLARTAAALGAVDPLSPLARGYAIVTVGGRALRDASEVSAGTSIQARLERGMLGARVESVNRDE